MTPSELEKESEDDLKQQPSVLLVHKWDRHAAYYAAQAEVARLRQQFADEQWRCRIWGIEHFPQKYVPEIGEALATVLATMKDATAAIESVGDAARMANLSTRAAELQQIRYRAMIGSKTAQKAARPPQQQPPQRRDSGPPRPASGTAKR
jgi:hypothetical protein